MHSDMFRHNAQLYVSSQCTVMFRHNAQLYVSSQSTVTCFVTMHSDMFRHNAQWYVSSQCIVTCFVTMHSDMFPRNAWWHVSSQCAVICFLTMPSDMFRQNAQWYVSSQCVVICFVTNHSYFFFLLLKHFDHFCCDSLVIKTFRSLTHSCIKTHHNSVFCLYFRTFWPTLLFFLVISKTFRSITEKNLMHSDMFRHNEQ